MTPQRSLKQKTDDLLVTELKTLITQERKILTEIIDHLREVERRRLYLKEGYSSLFTWMTEYLGYSEGAAQRRIQAMRLVRDLPEVEEKLSSGKLSLSVASQLQSFLRREDKKRKETNSEKLTKTKKLELVSQLEGTSSRRCEQTLAKISPETALPRDKTRPITDLKTQISFVAGKGLIQKIERLKSHTSHQNPEGSYEKLFEKAIEIALEKIDPIARQKRRERRAEPTQKQSTPARREKMSPSPKSPLVGAPHRAPGQGAPPPPTSKVKRNIPQPLKDHIWIRDEGRCQYQNKRTEKKCHSQQHIELDHQVPFSWGGEHSVKNLRLFCRNHNLYRVMDAEGFL